MVGLDIVIPMIVVSGASMAVLGFYGLVNVKRVPAALPYLLLMFFAAVWAGLYALDLAATTLPGHIFYHDLRFLFLPYLPFLEIWLITAWIGRMEWLTRERVAALLVIPVVASLLALTSPLHTLFRYDFSIDTTGPVPVLHYTDSAFFTLYNLYSLVVLVIALAILLLESERQDRLKESQTVLLFFAVMVPTVVNYLFVAGITPFPGVNMTPALFWIPAILYTVSIFRYRFLHVIPIARSRVIETMSLPVFVLDHGGGLIDMNPAAAGLIPIPPADAKGRPFTELAGDWPGLLDLCRAIPPVRADLTRGSGDGVRYYSGTVERVLSGSGRDEGRIVLLTDVTDQKRAEALLRESEEKFSRAFHSSPYVLIITRVPDGLVIDVNHAFVEITGSRAEDVIGRTTHDLLLWEDGARRQEVLGDLENGVPVRGRELRFRALSGRTVTGLLSADIIRIRDQEYVLSSFNDISDRKAAEEERERLIHVLEQKNRELEQFTYTVSHDLKSPIASVRGFLELMRMDLAKGDTSRLNHFIDRIDTSAARMELFMADLLTLSRIGRVINPPARVNFRTIAEEAVEQLDAAIRRFGVTVTIDPGSPDVLADTTRVREVLVNLLENAIKFRGDRADPAVRVGWRRKDEGTVFFVEDNGIGIPEKDRERIFNLFEKLDRTTGGSGAGLAIVRRIIEVHGGWIRAESEGPGTGTTFVFTLPLADEDTA